jgi:hypothetical protein
MQRSRKADNSCASSTRHAIGQQSHCAARGACPFTGCVCCAAIRRVIVRVAEIQARRNIQLAMTTTAAMAIHIRALEFTQWS